jgi:hypothetical protein
MALIGMACSAPGNLQGLRNVTPLGSAVDGLCRGEVGLQINTL